MVHMKWGYFDERGAVVIKPQFTDAKRFADGLAAVYVGGKLMSGGAMHPEGGDWVFVDKMGSMVIPARYCWANPFSEGLAFVKVGEQNLYVDRKGQVRIRLEGDAGYFGDSFSCGLAHVTIFGGKSEKSGFINKTRKFVIAPRFDNAADFSEGLAAVEVGKKWGYVDTTGRMIIRPQFAKAQEFHEGLAAAFTGGKWAFIDRKAVIVIKGPYNDAKDFEDGLALVHQGGHYDRALDGPSSWREGAWYYIDRTGRKIRLAWPDGE